MSACPPDSSTGRQRARPGFGQWAPYCLMCPTFGRMTETAFGFRCEGVGDMFGRTGCGNTINWDLTHYDAPASNAPPASTEGRRDTKEDATP